MDIPYVVTNEDVLESVGPEHDTSGMELNVMTVWQDFGQIPLLGDRQFILLPPTSISHKVALASRQRAHWKSNDNTIITVPY